MHFLPTLVTVLLICWICAINVVKCLPADNLDENTILSGNSDSVPIIGEVNAATIDVSAIKATQEEENPPTPPVLTLDDLKKKSVKQLKEFLKERSLECKGCSEKGDFVKLAYDNRETLATPPTTPEGSSEKKGSGSGLSDVPDGEKLDQSKIDELLAGLKRNGFGNNRFFNADDLRDLNPDELNAKFNDPNYKSKSSSKSQKKDKTSSSSRKTNTGKKESSSSKSKKSEGSKTKTESKSKGQKKPKSEPIRQTSSSTSSEHHDEETIEL